MESRAAEITSATNRNILLGILEKGSNRNAVATKAGIPTTTFNRKLNGDGDFTLRELGKIAEALDRQLADILPSELLEPRRVA
jgi:DNA-binding phage protein